jgi:hypothetical protein
MSRSAHSFKQTDVTKAIKGAVKAGFKVGRFEIEEGKIVIFAGDAEAKGEPEPNEWDGIE